MATTKNTAPDTTVVEEKKPRISRVERLRQQLALAEAKRLEIGQKKVEDLEKKAADFRTKAEDYWLKAADLKKQIIQAKAELPVITDGVGERNSRERDEPESDEPEFDEPEFDEPEFDEPEFDEPETTDKG